MIFGKCYKNPIKTITKYMQVESDSRRSSELTQSYGPFRLVMTSISVEKYHHNSTIVVYWLFLDKFLTSRIILYSYIYFINIDIINI